MKKKQKMRPMTASTKPVRATKAKAAPRPERVREFLMKYQQGMR